MKEKFVAAWLYITAAWMGAQRVENRMADFIARHPHITLTALIASLVLGAVRW